jgi:hypothetical protein
MTLLSRGEYSRHLRFSVVAIAMIFSLTCYAKSTGVVEDPALQSGPCYQALVDRNAAQPTTAPLRELGSACETEHGDVDKAWARVLRLWESDSVPVPDYDNYRPAYAPAAGAFPYWFAIVGMALVYAILGAPMRSAARLMGTGGGVSLEAIAALLASLIFRGLVGLALLWLLGVSYATVLGGILLVGLLLVRLNASGAPMTALASDNGQNPVGGASIFAAEVINDVAGSAIGLLGLALFAQRNILLLALGLVFAIAASTPILLLARRHLRANPLLLGILSALLAATVGALALADPPIAAVTGGAMLPSLLVPVALAIAILGAVWRNWNASRLQSGR